MKKQKVLSKGCLVFKVAVALVMAVGFHSGGLWAQGGMKYLFDENGCFKGRVENEGDASCIVLSRGHGRPALVAKFADPESDPLSIGENTRVVMVDNKLIRSCLKKSGATKNINHGIVFGTIYLTFNSNYGQRLDFSRNDDYGLAEDVFYITYTKKDGYVAHNKYNFGNFMWAAAAKTMGIRGGMAKLGSHLFNFFMSYYSKWRLDDRDDIFSINNGYHLR